MMQKNEDDLLEPWIKYHSNMFGAENLFIYDNGSTSPLVAEVLEKAAVDGVKVYFEFSEKAHFEAKGDIIADKIKELDRYDLYDFFLPLDCDEFVGVMLPDEQPSFEQSHVLAELERLQGTQRVCFIGQGLDNHPERPGYFRLTTDVKKTFFAAHTCKSLDIGFHDGKSVHSRDKRPSNLIYAHYHAKPFDIVRKHAKEKLAGRLSDFSPESLKEYRERRGKGHHLVRILLYPDAASYSASFKDEMYHELTSFIGALRRWDISLPFTK
jgi:hypothetical protein